MVKTVGTDSRLLVPGSPDYAEQLARDDARLLARAKRRRRLDRIQTVTYPVILVLLLPVFWQAFIAVTDLESYLLPPPLAVWDSLLGDFDVLLENSPSTMVAIINGFAMASIGGFLIALAIYNSRTIDRAVYPLLVAIQAVPKIALAPMVAIWFGFTITTKSLIAFVIAVFPVIINTLAGLRSVDEEKLLLARSMGLGRLKTFVKIRWPQAMPSLFAGLKVALALSTVGAIVGEFVGGDNGLGLVIIHSNARLNVPLMYSALVVLATYTILLFLILSVIEYLAMPWRRRR
jgi:NitT/TauT family transport system permease protein